MVSAHRRLILASGSSARQAMLRSAGLQFEIIPAEIDEDEVRAEMTLTSDCVEAADIASRLAIEKALSVARANPDALVIGSDQVLALGRRMFSKAATVGEAREVLDTLRGRTHELVSAVALASGHQIFWHTVDTASLTMRRFSDEYLAHYLEKCGAHILSSVGCYQLEGVGVQLFEKIEGDYFTILGMPLLPLLAELRRQGMVIA